MTDFRALCADLADELDAETGYTKNDGERIVHPTVALARIALTQPEPQEPSDEELHQLWLDLYAFHDGPTSGDVMEIARAVLARWGRTTRQED